MFVDKQFPTSYMFREVFCCDSPLFKSPPLRTGKMVALRHTLACFIGTPIKDKSTFLTGERHIELPLSIIWLFQIFWHTGFGFISFQISYIRTWHNFLFVHNLKLFRSNKMHVKPGLYTTVHIKSQVYRIQLKSMWDIHSDYK